MTTPDAKHEEWISKYGNTFRYKFLAGGQRLASVDLNFIGHVLQKSDDFIKPVRTQELLERLLGKGVLIAEHADHRRQRRVLNPAFSIAAIREMTPIFYDKAYELQRKLIELIEEPRENDQASPTPPKPEDQVKDARKIDVMRFLGAATLDVIGVAGFDYDFQCRLLSVWTILTNKHSATTKTSSLRPSATCSPLAWASALSMCCRTLSPSCS